MNEFKENLKKIPPWGYALIAVGVLFLAFLTKNKGGQGMDTTPVIQTVDPATATYNNDAEWRNQDMYNRLSDQLNEKDTTFQNGLVDLQQQILDLKKPVASVNSSSQKTFTAETGTYKDYNSANKAASWVRSNVGQNVNVSQDSSGLWRVKAIAPSYQGASDILNALKKKKLASTGYVV